jgi:formamidopyrimidine-DNA glycosylase
MRLAKEIRKVLQRSVSTGGSSISDYVNPDGQDGAYQDERMVYAREGKACKVCGTTIKRMVIGQRSSHFCPRCQS